MGVGQPLAGRNRELERGRGILAQASEQLLHWNLDGITLFERDGLLSAFAGAQAQLTEHVA